jgi:hypothetical protein
VAHWRTCTASSSGSYCSTWPLPFGGFFGNFLHLVIGFAVPSGFLGLSQINNFADALYVLGQAGILFTLGLLLVYDITWINGQRLIKVVRPTFKR